MRRFFTPYFIFLFLVCIPINSMDKSKELIISSGSFINLPKELIPNIEKYAGLIPSYNLASTCKYYGKIINPNNEWLKKYLDVVKNMDVDSYTKDMIFCAQSDNEYMFYWLKENTNRKNREETKYIFDHIYGPSCMDEKKSKLAIYKTSEYLEKEISEFVGYSDNIFPIIRLLIYQGFNINHQWKDGNTLLHFLTYGVNDDRHNTIKFLLALPEISVNIQNETGATPLHMAIRKHANKEESWQKYVEKERLSDMQPFLERSDLLINLQDKEGNTALHTAVIYENDEQIKCLIQRVDIDFDIQNNDGNTVLHYPKFYEYINLIPQFCANINSKNNEGNTPLHVAETFEQYDYLLKHDDVDVNIKNNKGETALHYSIKHPKISSGSLGHLEICIITTSWNQTKALLKDDSVDKATITKKGKALLHCAAKYNDGCKILKKLVENINVNLAAIDCQGRTALHMASKYHNDKAVEYLLQKMSVEIINLYDRSGYTALDYAITTLKNKNKEKWEGSSRQCCLVDRHRWKDKTANLFLRSDKVYVPFLFPYRRMVFCGLLVGLVGLSLFILSHYF